MSTMTASKDMHKFSSRHLTFWSLILTIIGLATMPIIIGYIFASAAIITGAIVIGREWNTDQYRWVAYGAWATTIASIGGMIGYIIYMMSFAQNYMG